MEKQEKRKYSLKANLIIEFLLQFNSLEKDFKILFNEHIKTAEKELKNKLYFYDTGLRLKAGITLDLGKSSFGMQNIFFKQEEEFKNFTLKNIVMIIDNHNEYFSFCKEEIDSIKNKMTSYNILQLITKFIEMRNVLAHEILDINFKEGKHFLEIFSYKLLIDFKIDWIEETDLDLIIEDEMLGALYSNIIYIKEVRKKIEKIKKG